MKLFLSFLFIGLCVFQLSYAAPAEDSDDWETLELVSFDGPSEEGIIQDIGEKAKVLINRVKNYFKKKVHSAFESFRKLEHGLQDRVSRAIDVFKPKLRRVVDSAKEKIKAKAAELKKDAKECLGASETSFKQLLKDFLVGEEHCVTDELRKGLNIVKSTVNNVLGAVNTVEALPAKLVSCLEGKDKLDCVKKNVWEAGKAQGKVLKGFLKDFADGAQFVVGFESRLAQCALTQVTKAAEYALTIVDKFPECVLNKVLKLR